METDNNKKYRIIFATRVFRDKADMDYIAARTLFRNDCCDEFLIFAQQCIEKYLKGILLYNKIPNKSMHRLVSLIEKCDTLPHFKINDRTREFIKNIDGFDELRYASYIYGSFFAERRYLFDLDYAVMDLRRYCTSNVVLAVALSSATEVELIRTTKKGGFDSGLLETVQKPKDKNYSVLRSNLIWKNPYFSSQARIVNPLEGLWAKGSGFSTNQIKEMYLAVKEYVHVPKEVSNYFNEDKRG